MLTKKEILKNHLSELPDGFKLISNIVVPISGMKAGIKKTLADFCKDNGKDKPDDYILDELANDVIKNGMDYHSIMSDQEYDIAQSSENAIEGFSDDLIDIFTEVFINKINTDDELLINDFSYKLAITSINDLLEIMYSLNLVNRDYNPNAATYRVFRIRFLDLDNEVVWINYIEADIAADMDDLNNECYLGLLPSDDVILTSDDLPLHDNKEGISISAFNEFKKKLLD